MNAPARPAFDGRIEYWAERRMPASVYKIVEGALRAVQGVGFEGLTMSGISAASGVSRGTLYRYFATKEEVLSTVSEFVSRNFEAGVRAAAHNAREPSEKLRAVLSYMADNHQVGADRMLDAEPAFALAFLRRNKSRHIKVIQEALTPFFDSIEADLGRPVARLMIVEGLFRMELSTLILPADDPWKEGWHRLADWMEAWVRAAAR